MPDIDIPDLPLVRKPGVHVAYKLDAIRRGLAAAQERILLITHDATGSTEPVPVISIDDIKTDFGVDSAAVKMALSTLKANPYADIQVMRLQQSGVPTDSVVIAELEADFDDPVSYGPRVDNQADDSGSLMLSFSINGGATQTISIVREGSNIGYLIGSSEDPINALLLEHNIQITQVISGSTLGAPVTIAVERADPSVLTVAFLAAFDAGIGVGAGIGDIDFSAEIGVVGQTFSFVSESATPLTDLFATIAPLSHTMLVLDQAPTSLEDKAAWIDYLTTQAGPIEQSPAVLVLGHNGTLAAAELLAASMPSHLVTIVNLPSASQSNGELAAGYAAVIASEPDPARPLDGLVIKSISAPPKSAWLTRTQFEHALTHGVTPLEVVDGKVEIVRAITTYMTDALMLDLHKTRSLNYVMADVRNALKTLKRQKNSQRVRAEIRGTIISRLKKLEEAEIVENVNANLGLLIVQTNSLDAARVDCRIPTEIIEGLHVIGALVELY